MAIASLPMYDLPEVAAATDDWWRGLVRSLRREGVRAVPRRLTRCAEPEVPWRAPDLLFSQTCGYPLTHALNGQLALVATPVYAAPACQGPVYRSLIVVRADDRAADLAELRGRTAAVNAPD